MKRKKYLIYVDILGFKNRAREYAEKIGLKEKEDEIREDFLSNSLRKKIKEIEKKGIQISRGISEIEGSDNYVLMINDIQVAFEVLGKLTKIGYVPLEIGLDIREIDEDIEVELINRKEIISLLKNDIIGPYKKYYEEEYGDSIKETFILLTKEFLDNLDPLDRKYCHEIPNGGNPFFIIDSKRIQQRCKIFGFLERIGYPNSKIYGRIDEIYVSPVEYGDIIETLKEKRIVFITGTQEYGKTYTAVRLMWEYYAEGYEPKWVKGGEQAERIIVRETLEDIGKELKPKRIIYFEDPFGKIKYERRESLERRIGAVIDTVTQNEDAYVIITSREEVFKEFEREKLSKSDIRKFEKRLNLKRPSYDYTRKKEILEKWAEKECCIWLKDRNLSNLIFEIIEDDKILPTPLSIRDFAKATISVDEESQIREKIKEKSEETAMAFSKEIKEMSDDKILFFSLLFIFSLIEIDFFREMYEKFMKELNLEREEDFENDKIGVFYEEPHGHIQTCRSGNSYCSCCKDINIMF